MAEPLNFRSAFNGFNREDVVHYIDYLNSNHENQIKQLQADLAALQKESFLPGVADAEQNDIVAGFHEQFAQQEAILTALNAEKDELIEKCSQQSAILSTLSAQNDELREKCTQLEAFLSVSRTENIALTEKATQLEEQLATVSAQKEAAVNAPPQVNTYMEEELAAYRRAERVERLANERASAIYRKLRVALQDTATQTDQAVSNLDSITDQFNAQISALRDSLADSKTSLGQSICSLDDICPKEIDE